MKRLIILSITIAALGCARADKSDLVIVPPEKYVAPYEDAEAAYYMERENEGAPLSDEEVAELTRAVTGMWKDTGYFDWVWWTSHGVEDGVVEGVDGYKLWWQDTRTTKEGDTITWAHTGGADNLVLRTNKVLTNAIAGYLMSGDERFRRIVIAYCKGLAALAKGFEFGPDDPAKYIQARATFTVNHSYEMEGGRKVIIDYDPVKQEIVRSWNAHTIPVIDNPYWSGTWARTMRSKDDVPHMYRTIPLVIELIDRTTDPEVRDAAELLLEYMVGFTRDIVDNGYFIRTKNDDGEAIVPLTDEGKINDLASFNQYDALVKGGAECGAKLGSVLIAYGEPREIDCGTGAVRNTYEVAATVQHYFNYAIIRNFHISSIALATINEQHEAARELMTGLYDRVEYWMNEQENREGHSDWDADVATQLMAAASAGLALTDAEAQHIRKWYLASAEHYRRWNGWDPWSDSIPDGEFNYKPDRRGPADPEDPESEMVTYIRPTEIPYPLEYCNSSMRNPNGARVFDCDIIADPSRWGE